MDALLELVQVSREFSVRRGFFDPRPASVRAVDRVSLSLYPGRTLGLVGESGCGKSTLARMVVGLLAPSSGEVLLSGRPLGEWTASERASRIQMVFQDPFSSLDPRQTVGAAVAEPLVLAAKASGHPLSRAESRARVGDILSRVGLQPEHIDRYPHEFSGGQRHAHGHVVVQAGVEELHGEGQALLGPESLFRQVADGAPFIVVQLGEEFGRGGGRDIGRARKILRLGLHIGKGEGGCGACGKGFRKEGGQQAEGNDHAMKHRK